jgi:hypothetical protein
MLIMIKTCQACALAQEMEPEGACFCLKHDRIRKRDETSWDWGCFYFTQMLPSEDYTPYQYLLMTETELATRK